MDQVALLLLQSFYLLLPAYFANMAPVIFRKINFLNVPVDFGYTLRIKKSKGKKDARDRIFGNHKTWRGIFFATLAGITIAYLQYLVQNNLFVYQIIKFIYFNKYNIDFKLNHLY